MYHSSKRPLWQTVFAALTALFVLQGCAFAPEKPEESEQQGALLRWNQCLERFDTNPEHYCDGHRRDVLATFPFHLENQVSALLSEQLRVKSASRLVKTGRRDATHLINTFARISRTNATVAASDDNL